MEYGSMSIQRLQSGRWLNWGIRFFLTAALTASQTAGGYAPFALGCIAAAGPGADAGAAALLGGVTGALLFLDFQQVLALAAVGILILDCRHGVPGHCLSAKCPGCCRCWRPGWYWRWAVFMCCNP